jgi:prepilin-type N-terminal cleavage/methylation domain-containing protein
MKHTLPLSSSKSAFTLAEMLIALALIGGISLSIANFVLKGNLYAQSMDKRFREAAEIQMLCFDIQQDLKQGASISNNSSDIRLEYTTYNTSGTAIKKIYQLSTSGGKQYLQVSTDGGSTWNSPYRMSSYTAYSLNGSPKFLYA